MEAPPRAFLESSALSAGVFSEEGGGRMVLRLGEAGAVRLLVSPQVLAQVEGAIRLKAPNVLTLLALLLDRSDLEVVPKPAKERVDACHSLVGHPADAAVLAAAWEAYADFLITLDQKHFLQNKAVRRGVPFVVGTPGEFLAWLKLRWG